MPENQQNMMGSNHQVQPLTCDVQKPDRLRQRQPRQRGCRYGDQGAVKKLPSALDSRVLSISRRRQNTTRGTGRSIASRLRLGAAAAAVMLFGGFSCLAQTTPPPSPKTTVPEPRLAPTGIPLDAVVDIEVDGVVFSIPAIYLTTWAKPQDLGKLHVHTYNPEFPEGGFEFAFWMPDRRPEEIKTEPPMLTSGLNERGVEPRPGEYPVVVLHARVTPPDARGLHMPAKVVQTMSAALGNEKDRREEMYGLTKVVYGKLFDPYLQFYSIGNSDLDIKFHCDDQSFEPVLNPLCQGYVYYWKEQASFLIRFPEEHLADWRQVTDAAKDLIVEWRKK